MHSVSGGCHCGNMRVRLELPRAAAEYGPRACDCEFCRKHGAAYVSDAGGALRFEIADDGAVARYRQGSGTAEFLVCRTCGVLVGVVHQGRYAAVNARAVDAVFAADQPVSPRQLAVTDRVARWQAVWFADVSFA
jgi:hypothetical protein